MRRSITALVSLACLFAFTLPASAAAPAAAKDCEGCHGAGGVSTHKDIPIIAGMSAFYLDGQIQAYQKDQRPCPSTRYPDDPGKPETDMCKNAKKLSPADATAVDKYFAAQKFVPAKQPFDAQAAARGKEIHTADCEKCHTDGGSVADDDAGILAGQWSAYLKSTIEEYRSGKRIVDKKMKPKIDGLTPDKVNDLVQYYASEGK